MADVQRVLVELLALEREIVEADYVRRSDALERVGDAVRRLGEIGSPQGILDRAAEELGTSSEFDRVVVSEVSGDSLVVRSVWSDADPGGAEAALDGASGDARSGSSIRWSRTRWRAGSGPRSWRPGSRTRAGPGG